MSAWRTLLISLREFGRPARRAQFDDTGSMGAFYGATRRAVALGLLQRCGDEKWWFTPTGLAWATNRISVVTPSGGGPGKGRMACALRLTWIASLPAPNSVRIAPPKTELTMGQRMARGDTAVQLAPPAPPCFGTRLQWTEYVRSCAIAHRGDHLPGPLVLEAGAPARFNPQMAFCADCSDSHAYVMRSEGRCKPRHLIELFAKESA